MNITNKSWILVLLLLLPLVVAQELPPGLVQVMEHQEETASDFAKNVSFLIAFIAGLTMVLSPCVLPLIPAFFAYTFKEKKRLTAMTLVFFLGTAATFIALGIFATAAGKLLTMFVEDINIYVTLAGAIMIVLGGMYFFGQGFSLVKINPKSTNDPIGVFIYGLLFGLGWVFCTGPVLSGILTMVSVFQNYLIAAWLMFFYSLGVFVPLFLISFYYDKYDLGKKLKGKRFKVNIFGEKVELHSNNMIAGSMFVLIGLVFVIFKGTWIVNGFGMFGLKNYFYSLQQFFLANKMIGNIIGGLILAGMAYGVWKFSKR